MARINLLPWREERRKARQTQFNILTGMVAAAGAVTVGMIFLGMGTAISIQNDRNKFLNDQITYEDRQIEKIKGLQDTKQALLARMQIIQQLQSSRPTVVHLFDQLALEGTAESSARISTYLRNIDASPWLGDPNLQVVQKDPVKNGAQHFSITARVVDKAAAAAKAAAANGGA